MSWFGICDTEDIVNDILENLKVVNILFKSWLGLLEVPVTGLLYSET